jgi:hypothetical protein
VVEVDAVDVEGVQDSPEADGSAPAEPAKAEDVSATAEDAKAADDAEDTK